MTPPNIILIMADELRWDCLGYAGNPDVRTPNLDALATHAVNFNQAICQYPLCVPSRTTVLTGRYVSEHGVCDNRLGLAPDTPTLPRLLRDAGYRTAAVGKMHFNPVRADYGLDTMVLAEQDGQGRYEDDYHAWLHERGLVDRIDLWDQVDRDAAPKSYWKSFGAMRSNLSEECHSTTWIGNQTVRFLQAAEDPFFLWCSFVKPHHPFDPPAPWDEMYDRDALRLPPGFRLPVPEEDARQGGYFDAATMTEARFRKVLAYYYAAISHLDHQVGRILATLTARGITNNIIVFCADHGDYMGQHGLILKGRQAYDSLLRVPLLVAGLTRQRRGVSSPALVELTDLLPTLLEAAGLETPSWASGKSLVPLLRGAAKPLREAAFAEAGEGRRILRTGRHKLVESSDVDQCALYDLENDTHEFDNRYGAPDSERIQGELSGLLAAQVSALAVNPAPDPKRTSGAK